MSDLAPQDAASFAAHAMQTYDVGSTTIYASKHDPRFSYCLYVPPAILNGEAAPDLAVIMHGTGRGFTEYREAFSAFGRWNNCIILAPLFPVGPLGDDNTSGFKYMIEGDIRYDKVMLAIVDEVCARYNLPDNKFGLFGYSGGGHFTHRFLMLHPDRLWAASIGAPGSVTLLDPTRDWWVGIRNFEDVFGHKLDIDAMKRVPVQMVVGDADLETWEITHKPGGRYWMPDANHAGVVRPERLARLRASFEEQGINVRFDLLPNMAHDGLAAVSTVEDFFAKVLKNRRNTPPSV